MLSIITIDASTIIPTPKIKPVKVIILRVIPAKLILKSVIKSESGIEIAIIIVDFTFCKNIKRTITASKSPCQAESTNVLIVSRIESVSSEIISSFISDGRVSFNSSIFSWTLFETVTEFASVCFVIVI